MYSAGISVVVPTYNEAGNIVELLKRIKKTLDDTHHYEIILVDDNSTDDTQKIVLESLKSYPVSLFVKPRSIPQGKAESLIYGFDYAKFDHIAMIDADLQYPPESIPHMMDKITRGVADVVVANRVDQKTKLLRQFMHAGFRYVFGRLLHNLDCDVQSGLKVFKTEIIKKVSITPTRWTFDLEFLLQSRRLGYTIDTVDIVFSERTAGQTKIQVMQAAYEIGMNALLLKFRKANSLPINRAEEFTLCTRSSNN